MVGSIAIYALLWEVISRIVAHSVAHPEYVMPTLEDAVRHGIPGVSDYYQGLFGGTPPSRGGQRSFGLGVLALIEHSLISLMRFALGLLLGVALGVGLGVAMAWFRPPRLALLGLSNLLRMLPILAMAPLFTLWFGARTAAGIAFIAFAIAPIMLISTMTSISALDPDQVRYARTLGASQMTIRRRIILPAIVPGIAGALGVATVLGWSALLASELYGIQDGVGWMMGQALQLTQMPAVMVIGATFIVLAYLTSRVVSAFVRRLSQWVE